MFQVSGLYQSEAPTRISLAADHKGDLFSREKLLISEFELSESGRAEKFTFFVPAAENQMRGLLMIVQSPAKGASISGLTVKGKKSYQVNFSRDMLLKNRNIKPDNAVLTISPSGEAVTVPLLFPDKLRVQRQFRCMPFIYSLFIALLLAVLFYWRVPVRTERGNIAAVLFAATALGVMVFPVMGIDFFSKVSDENRFYQSFPEVKTADGFNRKFPAEFEKFLGDRFYGRDNMIEMNSSLFSLNWLKFSGKDQGEVLEQGIRGRDNWLFSKFFDSVAMAQNKNRFSDEELQRCAEHLEALEKYFAERFNAPVYVVLMPDKERVYSEYYPPFLLKQRKHPESRLEQLTAYLKTNTKLRVIAPLPELLAAKDGDPLYYPTGTHQTYRGAYISALAVRRELEKDFPQLRELPENISGWEVRKNADVDVAKILGYKDPQNELPESLFLHREPVFINRYAIHRVKESLPISMYINRYHSRKFAKKGIRLLAVTDSFWGNMFPFMLPAASDQFHVLYGDGRDFVFEPFHEEVEKFRPQAVVIESTERFLHRFLTIKYRD